jgi:O-antigen/teichoic acid export membrane protein
VKRALGFAFAAEAATTLCQIAGFKLAFALWGGAGFGEWMLARRLLAFVLPLATLGLDVAVPRYVALARAGEGPFASAAILAAAVRMGVFGAGLVFAALGVFRDGVAAAAFGDSARAALVLPTAALVLAYAIHVLVYGYLRGASSPALAGALHVGVHGVLPLGVFALRPESPARALIALALGTLACAIAVGAVVFRRDTLTLRAPSPAATRALMQYGGSRAAAALGLLLLATLPAALTARAAGLEQAGVVAFGLSLIGIAGTAATPIGVALLPAASVHFAKRGGSLLPPPSKLRGLAAAVSALGGVLAFALAPAAARMFFDTADSEATLSLRLCALAAGPYFFFCFMRTLVDAQTARAVNARVVGVALLAFFVALVTSRLAFGIDPVIAAVGSYDFACLALAAGIWPALSASGGESAIGAHDSAREARIA